MTNLSVLTKNYFDIEVVQDVKLSQLRNFLNEIAPLYPCFDSWLAFKFYRGLKSDSRKLLMAHDGNQILGTALLKQDSSESKICTFYVAPEFRGAGIGSQLMTKALNTLDSEDTFITVADERLHELKPLLNINGFGESQSIKGLYREESEEHIFSL